MHGHNLIPENWVLTKLENICMHPQYGWTTSAHKNGKIHLLRTTDITSGRIDWNSVPYCRDVPDDVGKYLLKEGDIVISRAGSIGISHLIKNPERAVFASYLIRFKPLISGEYISYFLMSPIYWNFIAEKSSGIAIPNVNSTKLRQLNVPLAPLQEQKRIVSKLEELITKLDAGIEYLKKTKTLLKQYRQSVLKYAFEGRLTEKWRQKHQIQIQFELSDLSKKIEERNKHHQPKNNAQSSSETIFSDMPDIWQQSRLNIVCHKIQDGSHFSPEIQYKKSGSDRFLYITAKNITKNGLDLSDVTYVDRKFHEEIYRRCNPEKGDVLLIKDGVKTGIASTNHLDEQFSLLSSVALFKPVNDILNSMYLKHFFNSPVGFNLTTGQMTGTAIKRIILDKIRNSPVPIPTLSEQEEIVKQVEFHLSIYQKSSQIIQEVMKHVKSLRRSILNTAFEGKLVPQDPNDESAEILLQRVKQERSKFETSPNSKKINTKFDDKQSRLL
jgi:type I restriction enzyme S subunit